jgi:two-component system chemotaxis response regulator CheB
MRVLIVDDSVTMRSAVRRALQDLPGVEIVGAVGNGRLALARLELEAVDLMTLDLEMPEMDGLQTLSAMASAPMVRRPRVIVLAAAADAGYPRVVEALRLGASDFVAKPAATGDGGLDGAIEALRQQLAGKLRGLEAAPKEAPAAPVAPPAAASVARRPWTSRNVAQMTPSAVVIASSTGGPVALERLLTTVRAPTTAPILIAQHMPPPFTKGLAERLSSLTGLHAAEAVAGEPVLPNRIYVAPADFHMVVQSRPGGVVIGINQDERVNHVRPAADWLFRSAAQVYGKELLAFVLTGMGEDGAEGARLVKEAGGGVVIQDRATSVVWGMPGAVHELGAFDLMASIDECGALCARATHRREAA